jgi:hypothetical protein
MRFLSENDLAARATKCASNEHELMRQLAIALLAAVNRRRILVPQSLNPSVYGANFSQVVAQKSVPRRLRGLRLLAMTFSLSLGQASDGRRHAAFLPLKWVPHPSAFFAEGWEARASADHFRVIQMFGLQFPQSGRPDLMGASSSTSPRANSSTASSPHFEVVKRPVRYAFDPKPFRWQGIMHSSEQQHRLGYDFCGAQGQANACMAIVRRSQCLTSRVDLSENPKKSSM